jgi:two-component system response regulator WspF
MRVAIVNDIGLAREALRRVVLSSGSHTVAWMAENGDEAVHRAVLDPPDVILMDLVMPVMDGVEATRRIMQEKPCPILLVTSSVTANFNMVYRAMGYGGLDAVDTPTVGPTGEMTGSEGLLSRLAKIARTKSSKWPDLADAGRTSDPSIGRKEDRSSPIVAMGASTGGPAALAKILGKLPEKRPAAVVIVQHIGANFAPSLARWLHDQSSMPVRLVRVGDVPQAGDILLAGSDDHLILREDGSLGYTAEPASYPYRPSVDVFFRSLARNGRRSGVAVLLTGMGDDGAKGLLELRHRGWHTIAQDQASSVVYGMPKAASEWKASCENLSLDDIPQAIRRSLSM